MLLSEPSDGDPGQFERNADVGRVSLPGSARFDEATGQYLITFDEEYADWFAHPSPDGKWLVFLSYDKSVVGHPANKQVTLRLMPVAGGQPKALAHLFGGKGTINVPSWSPDSKHVAFVSYRLVAGGDETM